MAANARWKSPRSAWSRGRGRYVGLVVARDISDQRAGSAELQHREEMFRTALEAGRMGTWAWDLRQNSIVWADEVTIAMGLQPRVFADGFEPFLSNVHPDDALRLAEGLLASTRQAAGIHQEYRAIDSKGRTRWILVRGRTLADERGPATACGVILDISAQKYQAQRLQALTEELRRLNAGLNEVREQERTHISREIHDRLGQSLTALKMDLALCKREAPPTGPLPARLETMSRDITDLIRESRKLSSELRPDALALGLPQALTALADEFAQRHGIAVEKAIGPINPPPELAVALYRIAQESLTNVARHAKATRVRVGLTSEGDLGVVSVADDGIGLQPEKGRPGALGLVGMRERAEGIQGELRVESPPEGGTRISCSFPLPPPSDL